MVAREVGRHLCGKAIHHERNRMQRYQVREQMTCNRCQIKSAVAKCDIEEVADAVIYMCVPNAKNHMDSQQS